MQHPPPRAHRPHHRDREGRKPPGRLRGAEEGRHHCAGDEAEAGGGKTRHQESFPQGSAGIRPGKAGSKEGGEESREAFHTGKAKGGKREEVRKLTMFSSTTEQRVYYADTDHGELDREGILLPVVEVKCEYKSPALYNDIILIETSIMKIGNKSITFSYGILRKEGRKLLAQGHTVNVFARGASSTEIPPDIRKKLEKS